MSIMHSTVALMCPIHQFILYLPLLLQEVLRSRLQCLRRILQGCRDAARSSTADCAAAAVCCGGSNCIGSDA